MMEEPGYSHNQNAVVQPLLTDLYQITMAYAYWKSGKTDDSSVFDLYFRKNPFEGEFTIFAGLDECLKFIDNFRYSDDDIEYLRQTLPEGIEAAFFDYLSQLTAKEVTVHAIEEGSVVFPRVPIIRVEGPLIIVQLLETTLLTLVNYASLMATNAARYRMVAGKHIKLLEFGLRRAQGPDGGLSASKYSYIGGFDGTSNVLAGKLFNIPVKGTHAHAYITSFSGFAELKTRNIKHKEHGTLRDLLELAIGHRKSLSQTMEISTEESSEGELAAMVSFAIAFPDGFMALVDTYDVKSSEPTTSAINDPSTHATNGIVNTNGLNVPIENAKVDENSNCEHASNNENPFNSCTESRVNGEFSFNIVDGDNDDVNKMDDGTVHKCQCNKMLSTHTKLLKTVGKSFRSGLLNFCAVALALNDQGYRALGIRIDSGDLAYLSCLARETFEKVAVKFKIPWFNTLTIVASNDINEETILSLNEQGHKIDCFGIGTHLVTCQRQPALGCVYKLVEINGQARIKLSQDVEKVTMPGNKNAYRLYSADGHALIDLLQKDSEDAPKVGQKVLCRHPFQESKRAYVIPSRVEPLYKVYWKEGRLTQPRATLEQTRDKVKRSLEMLRSDHKRNLNPTPYKVAVSDDLYSFIHDLWLQNAPIGELS
ncbi:hypothetical protein HA402_000783 [Bradysia odoriphaga]|nr:hypothetical protein HA402_000783 [Bradysia odoriphaga]